MQDNYRTIQYGAEYWKMYENGHIERPGLVSPSEQWRIVGAVERNNFGYVTRFYNLAEVFTLGPDIQWQHKNGKQKTFMRDFDHGAIREWGSPNHKVF